MRFPSHVLGRANYDNMQFPRHDPGRMGVQRHNLNLATDKVKRPLFSFFSPGYLERLLRVEN